MMRNNVVPSTTTKRSDNPTTRKKIPTTSSGAIGGSAGAVADITVFMYQQSMSGIRRYPILSSATSMVLLLVLLFTTLVSNQFQGVADDTATSTSTTSTKSKILLEQQQQQQQLPTWELGMFDIHHLRIGPGQSSFVIMPDGTTLLIDGGSVNFQVALHRLHTRPEQATLQIRPPYPNANKSSAGWIIDYVQQFWPRINGNDQRYNNNLTFDYVLITHFHQDHLGEPKDEQVPVDVNYGEGGYKLAGITEVGHTFRIHKLIDRGYPNYDYPHISLSNWSGVANYRKFINIEHNITGRIESIEQFIVGSTEQIRMLHPDNTNSRYSFRVKNLKSNLQVVAPVNDNNNNNNNNGTTIVTTIEGTLFRDEQQTKWDENLLSTAIVIEYANFRYYEGGDQEIQKGYNDHRTTLDTVTPTALAAGKVHVATANHHGRGTNAAFLDRMDPHVVILQGLFSDQPTDTTMKLLRQKQRRRGDDSNNDDDDRKQLLDRLLFVTDIYDERLQELGELAQNAFAAMNGHVVVRVHAPNSVTQEQVYEIYVLDSDNNNNNRAVLAHFGPFPVQK